MLTTALTALSLLATTASAQGVEYTWDQGLVQKLGLDTGALEGELDKEINHQLRINDQTNFLGQMSNAAMMSAKGTGVDYASNAKLFVVGGSLGTSVSASGASFVKPDSVLPPGGFALQASGMVGLNLGAFNKGQDSFLDRMRLYANGFAMEIPPSGPFAASILNFGGHLQIKVVESAGKGVAKWGGLDVTTGFQHTAYTLTLVEEIPIEPNDDLTWTADGEYTIDTATNAVPIEVSTNLRALFATVFVGLGGDVGLGGAHSNAELTGPIEAEAGGDTQEVGTASINVQGEGVPSSFVPRAFTGLQLNGGPVKLYGQVNVGLNQTFGGNFGLRVAI